MSFAALAGRTVSRYLQFAKNGLTEAVFDQCCSAACYGRHKLFTAPLQAFLESSAVRAALNKTGSALAALTVLKKICDHPALLSERAASLVARAG